LDGNARRLIARDSALALFPRLIAAQPSEDGAGANVSVNDSANDRENALSRD
jgi:hypothetical protein